jgi:hypothetical protein
MGPARGRNRLAALSRRHAHLWTQGQLRGGREAPRRRLRRDRGDSSARVAATRDECARIERDFTNVPIAESLQTPARRVRAQSSADRSSRSARTGPLVPGRARVRRRADRAAGVLARGGVSRRAPRVRRST